jgi:23S rRNA (cytosine1962-C5)-methyltransferase
MTIAGNDVYFQTSMISIYLKKGRDKPLRNRHPWVFSGAIALVRGEVSPGDQCQVFNHDHVLLGTGYYNPHSSIAIRMLAYGNEEFTEKALCSRIEQAISIRNSIICDATDSCRLINSEGDLLPGLIVDKYGSGVCIQIVAAGMERYRSVIVESLNSIIKPAFIYERSEGANRKQEGLEQRNECISGVLPDDIIITENNLRFSVNLRQGQKTGFFFDQRDNRQLFSTYAKGKTVCDCFAYTGGFSCGAFKGQANSVISIDSSAEALVTARKNITLNGFKVDENQLISVDVFEYLRKNTSQFDLICLDPPKFAKHQADVEQAARGYKDINLLAIKRLAPGGILFTFSCSQAIDRKLFRQIAFAAAADSGRDVQVLHTLSQPPDHPINISHLEG